MSVAVVTGAAQGLGRATAERLARDGYEVVVLDVNEEGAAAVASGLGGKSFACDVTDRERVQAVAQQVGSLDVLVNNAGIWSYGPIVGAADHDIDRVVAVNLVGTLNCCRAFAPAMIESGGGAIINLSSAAAAVAATVVEVYPITKGAIEVLTRQLAQELGPQGVRVNAIGPGSMLTEGTAPAYEGERYEQRAQLVPLRRIGTPEDIANAISFLVSDQASYISGQILYVDGGITAQTR